VALIGFQRPRKCPEPLLSASPPRCRFAAVPQSPGAYRITDLSQANSRRKMPICAWLAPRLSTVALPNWMIDVACNQSQRCSSPHAFPPQPPFMKQKSDPVHIFLKIRQRLGICHCQPARREP